MEPNHGLISGLRLDTATAEDCVERRIKNEAADSDWDVICVNISSSRSSQRRPAWFDLLWISPIFTHHHTHSSLIASCSANRVHCISSCCWQPKESTQPYTYLVMIFPLHLYLTLVITSLPFKVPQQGFLQHRVLLLLSDKFHVVCFHLLFPICWCSLEIKEQFITTGIFTRMYFRLTIIQLVVWF